MEKEINIPNRSLIASEKSWFYAAKGDRVTQIWVFLLHALGLGGLFFIELPQLSTVVFFEGWLIKSFFTLSVVLVK